MKLKLLTAAAALLASSGAWAEAALTDIKNNEVADAEVVMGNFNALANELNSQDLRLDKLEKGEDVTPVLVDCSTNPSALNTVLESHYGDGPPLAFELAGACKLDEVSGGITRRISLTSAEGGQAEISGTSVSVGADNIVIFVEYGGHLSITNVTLHGPMIWYLYGASGSLVNNTVLPVENAVRPTFTVGYGSSLRYFGDGGTATETAGYTSLEARDGSHITLSSPTGTFQLTAFNNASIRCSSCEEANFSAVKLNANSSLCAGGFYSDVTNISELTVLHNSSAIGFITADAVVKDDSSLFVTSGNSSPCRL